MVTPARGPWQRRGIARRRSTPPLHPKSEQAFENKLRTTIARRIGPRGVYGRRPRSPPKIDKIKGTLDAHKERPGVQERRPEREPPSEYMEDARRRPQQMQKQESSWAQQATIQKQATVPTSGVSLPSRREPPSRAHDGQRSYVLPATRVRPTGRKMGSSDPRERAAGGRRVSLEGAGVWAFKMSELRMQEGKEERKIERERDIKLELKGIKTGNKKQFKKFILFVRSPGGVQQQR